MTLVAIALVAPSGSRRTHLLRFIQVLSAGLVIVGIVAIIPTACTLMPGLRLRLRPWLRLMHRRRSAPVLAEVV